MIQEFETTGKKRIGNRGGGNKIKEIRHTKKCNKIKEIRHIQKKVFRIELKKKKQKNMTRKE